MKKYIVYAAAALIGFHLRWLVSTANGWSYSMNGMDIAMAITCIIMVWAFKGAFLPNHKRAHARHNAVSERYEP